jgi:hypothetical protein
MAERPTWPLPRRPACRAIAAARPAGQPGEQPDDLLRHPGLERDIFVGPPFLVPRAAARPGRLVREAFPFRLLKGWFLDQDALPLVSFPGPAPPDDDRRQAARLLGPPGERGVAGREELQVVQVGAGQAQRARAVHDQQVAVAVAAARDPVPDRHDPD